MSRGANERLLLIQAKLKMESNKVEEDFVEEISRFNCNFSLEGSEEEQNGRRKQTETVELVREVEMLQKGAVTFEIAANEFEKNS